MRSTLILTRGIRSRGYVHGAFHLERTHLGWGWGGGQVSYTFPLRKHAKRGGGGLDSI